MKKSINIISLILSVVFVLSLSLFSLIPTYATQIDDDAYQFKFTKNVSVSPTSFIEDLGLDSTEDIKFVEKKFITISNGLSGLGDIGYNAATGCFYVSIYDYINEGCNWVMKYDSTGSWWYKTRASEGSWSDYQSYNSSSEEIFFGIGESFWDLDARLLISGLFEDTTVFYTFKVNGISDGSVPTFSDKILMPDVPYYNSEQFVGWSDGVSVFSPNVSYCIDEIKSLTLNAVYSDNNTDADPDVDPDIENKPNDKNNSSDDSKNDVEGVDIKKIFVLFVTGISLFGVVYFLFIKKK